MHIAKEACGVSSRVQAAYDRNADQAINEEPWHGTNDCQAAASYHGQDAYQAGSDQEADEDHEADCGGEQGVHQFLRLRYALRLG
jgi:hypothetical protein